MVRTPVPSSFRGRYPLRLADLFPMSFPCQRPERRLGKIANETKIACSLASPDIEIQGKREKKRNWRWRGNRTKRSTGYRWRVSGRESNAVPCNATPPSTIDKFTGYCKQCGNNVNYADADRAVPAVINRIRTARDFTP